MPPADDAGLGAGAARRVVGTVRFRITAVATAVVLVVLVATGFALVSEQRRVLTESVDEGVEGNVADLEDQVVAGDLPRALTGLGEDDTVAQVVDADGEVVRSSANIAGEPPIAAAPTGGVTGIHTVEGIPVDEDEQFRLLSQQVDGPDGPVVIHVAATLDDIDESAATLTASLLVAIPVVVVVLALLVWWLVGRTLGPVEAIRAEVASIGGSDLHRRVPVPPHDDEIGRLARTMNDMLDRMQHAGKRQQQFVADASHELRSPLTRMRAALEVDLAHPEGADAVATHRSVLEETVGLQHLVDDLLRLARSDANPVPSGERRTVDLDDLVLRLVRQAREQSSNGERPGRDAVRIDASGVTAAPVVGHPGALARVVGNLLDNAVRHAETTVTVTLGEVGGDAVLTVADDGPGIPADRREWVFERFTRLDDARRAGTGGAGLGLAIARDIVHQHGGTAEVDPHHRLGARFVVRVPLADAPAGRSGAAGSAAAADGVVDHQHDHRTDDRGDQPAAAEHVVAVEDQPPDEPTDVGADDPDGQGHPERHGVVAGDEQPGQVPGDDAHHEQADQEADHRAISSGDEEASRGSDAS